MHNEYNRAMTRLVNALLQTFSLAPYVNGHVVLQRAVLAERGVASHRSGCAGARLGCSTQRNGACRPNTAKYPNLAKITK